RGTARWFLCRSDFCCRTCAAGSARCVFCLCNCARHFGFPARASRRPFAEPDPLTPEEVPCAHDRRLLLPSQPDRTGWLAPGRSLAPQVDGGLGPDSLTLSNVVTPGGAPLTQWQSNRPHRWLADDPR